MLCTTSTVCLCILRDMKLCTSDDEKRSMIERLWKIFEVDSSGLRENTIRQLSDIMRFLEIQWEASVIT